MKTKPQVIFLDAVGTLFGVKDTVGSVYTEIADHYGVQTIPQLINRYFYQSFKASPPCVFKTQAEDEVKQFEFEWWKEIAENTFKLAGVIQDFPDFDLFFTELYAHFQTDKPWYTYPDVFPSLDCWRQQDIELGIISNFDTRLFQVLEQLQLAQYFRSITISSLAGSAKPNAQIFQCALAKHNCLAENACHIGDSIEEDYWGAKSLGMNSFWLQR